MVYTINTEIDKGLSEFVSAVDIIRTDKVAEIIIDYLPQGPIRLLGFYTDPNKSDWDIAEEGYHYYQLLKQKIKNEK